MTIDDDKLEAAKTAATERFAASDHVMGAMRMEDGSINGINMGGSNIHDCARMVFVMRELADILCQQLINEIGEEHFQELYDIIRKHNEAKIETDEMEIRKIKRDES